MELFVFLFLLMLAIANIIVSGWVRYPYVWINWILSLLFGMATMSAYYNI
jgi:hypothetical protein